jgi:hypothetical protein
MTMIQGVIYQRPARKMKTHTLDAFPSNNVVAFCLLVAFLQSLVPV